MRKEMTTITYARLDTMLGNMIMNIINTNMESSLSLIMVMTSTRSKLSQMIKVAGLRSAGWICGKPICQQKQTVGAVH